jgi:hypothetical protein
MPGPEALVIAGRLGAHLFDVRCLEPGFFDEFPRGGEAAFFDENGFDVLTAHGREV